MFFVSSSSDGKPLNANTFSPVVLKASGGRFGELATATHDLGRLDGLVSSPNRGSRVRVTDSKKIAAILLETNIVELQRHLLTITVQNQVNISIQITLIIIC